MNTIEKLLTEKVELLKELDVKILDLCSVEDIVQEINETEEVYSRVCDVRVKISKFSSESIVTNGKDIVQGVESNTIEGNTDTQNHSQVSEAIFTPASLQDTNTNLVEDTNTQITNTQISNTQISNTNTQISSTNTQLSSTNPLTTVRSKLPKLILPKFKGDVTSYRSFWEIFESTVHNNMQLTIIDKFNYLVSLLEGSALRSIKGHQAALDILQERFGNSQQIISTHMDELLKLQPCTSEKSSQLRYMYDKVSVNVRGLEAMGIHSEQYGSLLIPVIMCKLPIEVRLQIARNTKKDVWVIKDLLELIRKEVEARELSEHVKVTNEVKQSPNTNAKNVGSISSLVAQGGQDKGSVMIKCASVHM